MRIHAEGKQYVYTLVPAGTLMCLAVVWWGLAGWTMLPGALLLLAGLVLAVFFRDPDRAVPEDPATLVAAADGRVLRLRREDYSPELDGPAQVLSVFMSPMNVHVNRSSLEARVSAVKYRSGRYLAAFHDKSSDLNEACTITLCDQSGHKVALKQIAGFLARRVICAVHEGDELEKGERYGIIKLGSRLDHFLPPEVRIAVAEGDRVRAGETVIGEWT